MNRHVPWAQIRSWILLISVGLIWLVPLVWAIFAALVPTPVLIQEPPINWFSKMRLDAFVAAWQVAPFQQYYMNTVIFVFGLLFLQMITVSLAGFALARLEFWGKGVIFLIFLTQLMVPASVLVVPNYRTIVDLRWHDTYLAMMAPYITSALGTFLMRQSFKQVPRELEDSARIDGANVLQILRHVFLPITRPSLIAFSVVSVTYHWNEFLWPLLVTNTPRSRPLTVGLSLLTQMSEQGAQWDLLAAGTLIVATPVLIFLMVLQGQFAKSFLRSGIR